jgi:tetratricopeptide (TPR) repeat protein
MFKTIDSKSAKTDWIFFINKNRIFKIILFFTALFLFQFTAFGEDAESKKFDSIFIHITTVMSLQNEDSAIIAANSLLEKSKDDPIKKMKCLMLLATLKKDKGDVLAALVHASNADKIATKEENIEWRMRIAGFLYSTYNDIDLPEQGKPYLKKVERLNKTAKIELIQLYVHQAKANSYLDDSMPRESLNELIKADSLIKILSRKKGGQIIIATNYQIKALCYFQLNELDKAKESFNKAMELIPDNFSVLLGFLYVGLANTYLKENDSKKAFYYLNETEPILKGSQDYKLEFELNNAWKSYYLETNNPILAAQYENKLLKMESERAVYLGELSNKLIQELKEDSAKTSKKTLILFSIISSLVILIVMIVLYNIDRRKQQQKKYETIVTEVKDMFENE